MKSCFRILPVVAALATAPHLAMAQSAADYPSKPVRVIVAGGAGGGVDVQSRMYAQKLSENMSEELAKTVKSPDIQKRLAEDGGIAVGSTPAEFQKLLAEEVPRWRKVVNETGIKAD